MNKRLRDWRRKIKFALSSDGAFFAVTGKKTLEEIKWAYEALSPEEKNHSHWLAGKLKLDKHKGHYLVAWFFVQGKARQDIGKQYAGAVSKVTQNIVKKFKLDKEGK